MKGLYKGKYLIAVYDDEGYLLDVACSPSELSCFGDRDKNIIMSYISHIANGSTISRKIFLIDVTEKYNDIFAEEDKLFLDFVNETRKKTKREKAQILGMSARGYYVKSRVLEQRL